MAVSVVSDEEEQERLERQWEEFGIDVPLEIVYSPYRELTRPILRYIDELDARWENDIITVLLPEFVVRHWWGNLLHNQTALLLKGRLLFRKGTVVTSLPVPPRVRTPTRGISPTDWTQTSPGPYLSLASLRRSFDPCARIPSHPPNPEDWTP